MFVASALLIFCYIGTLGAWRSDIDINRVKLLPKDHKQSRSNLHTRRSIFYHDHDDNRSGLSELRAPMQFLPDALPTPASTTIKIHPSREDPRLFYVSDAYAKEVNQKDLNNEVLPAIYPGGDVVLPSNNFYSKRNRPVSARLQHRGNNIPEEFNQGEPCTKCPHDITVIAKAWSDRVKVPHPRLRSCSGGRVGSGVRYEHMHGPRFGSLLTAGSYSIVGRITFRGKILRHCIMEVRVLTQTCPLPKHLLARCDDQNNTCDFACRDIKSELYGSSRLSCGDDNKWMGSLPACKVKTWCELLSPPNQGRISCKGATVKGGLAEGSVCRVRCARGLQWDPRPVTICRRGSWTNQLNCVSKL